MSECNYTTYMTDIAGPIPFCPGCGHSTIIKALDKALVKLQLDPVKTVLVTDIGCIGLADRYFITSAFHGLHGRSITYACGIKLARPDLKVIAIMGDGASGIGGAHLLNVSRRNIGITLIIANNFNYGMTGGQHSVTTPKNMLTSDTPRRNTESPLDLCAIVTAAGAPWVYRTTSFDKNLPDIIADAIEQPGLAVLDIWELCTAYFQPKNKFGRKELEAMINDLGFSFGLINNNPRETFSMGVEEDVQAATFSEKNKKTLIDVRFENNIRKQTGVIIAGGAGQKIKSTSTLFAKAAILSGLQATQKDDYPITVQTGHSVSEIILSPEKIEYTQIESPDYVLVISNEGAKRIRKIIERLATECVLIADENIELPETNAKVLRYPLAKFGLASSVIAAIVILLKIGNLFPIEALNESVSRFQHSEFMTNTQKAIAKAMEIEVPQYSP